MCAVRSGVAADPKPPAGPAEGTTRVTYLMNIVFGPCSKLLKTYIKSSQGYELLTQCQDPAGPANARTIDQREFDTTVYAKPRLTPTLPQDPTYGQIALTEVKAAPKGTTRCHRSSNRANSFCENARGIITYSAFDGHKLKPPKRGANRWYLLVKYEEP